MYKNKELSVKELNKLWLIGVWVSVLCFISALVMIVLNISTMLIAYLVFGIGVLMLIVQFWCCKRLKESNDSSKAIIDSGV